METLEFLIEPASSPRRAHPKRPHLRRHARRSVRRRVTVPKPAPLGLQIVALVLLAALLVGSVVFAIEVDALAARMAAGGAFLIGSLVLVAWAALALGTGIGPRQIIEVLKQLFGAARDATKTESSGGDERVGQPAGTPA